MQCSGTCTTVNVTPATPLATALMIKVEISFPFIDGAISLLFERTKANAINQKLVIFFFEENPL